VVCVDPHVTINDLTAEGGQVVTKKTLARKHVGLSANSQPWPARQFAGPSVARNASRLRLVGLYAVRTVSCQSGQLPIWVAPCLRSSALERTSSAIARPAFVPAWL